MAEEEEEGMDTTHVAGDALGEKRPFEGLFVEVIGAVSLQGLEDEEVDEDGDDDTEIDMDNKRGRCISWLDQKKQYRIETLSGSVVEVSEENLREYWPPAPEEGGFDVVWPSIDESSDLFAEAVCAELAAKGFCVVQTFLSPATREEAVTVAEAGGERHFYRMKQEIEGAYMGYESNSKVAHLEHDTTDSIDAHAAGDALEACNRRMSALGVMLAPLSPFSLGFNCHGRINALIRMSDDDETLVESIMDDDDADQWTANIESWVRFQQRRRLAVLCMISNKGGDLWLYPKDPKAGFGKSVHIPITQNKILLFRHDLMEYSYQVRGPSLALQTWILDDPPVFQQIKEMQVNLGVPGERGEVVVNPGPDVPDGPKASIMSLAVRMPGESWTPGAFWQMFCIGTDSVVQWPASRWDLETYYEEGGDANLTGKSYTCHGGFLSQMQIEQFDNDFFGISHMEARSMLPGQRLVMEVGYQCLASAGFTRKTLSGRRMGVWIGDAGPDWHSLQTGWHAFCPETDVTTLGTSMNNSVTCSRLAHTYDLRGPTSSYDTACSASLVAMNAAHLAMFDSDPPRRDNAECLVQGVNTLLGPVAFVANCQATMLTRQGRSFTFNKSADGYQRGEGCGAMYIKVFEGDKTEELERAAALVGTATNQDGRSASLTAPNGPAQQQVIRKSMRFAGIDPNAVSIAECHGTGTALGDPIEIGALMAVMHKREFPILKTSAKSNIAHLEAGAGIAGISKCVMMLNVATAPPNQHLNCLNPHLSVEGYPCYFETDPVDSGFSSLYCGVSSFGFGGTNSRADVYGFATRGHKSAIRYELPKPIAPRVQPIGQNIFICGTWTGWKDYDAMERGTDGAYRCTVRLGPSRFEKFFLSCSQDAYESIHPLFDEADQMAQIVGPDWDGKGLNFMIDGRGDDGVPEGTVFEVCFTWTEERKKIAWQKVAASYVLDDARPLGGDFEHSYQLRGSWRDWQGFQELQRVEGSSSGSGTVPTFEGTFRIGFRLREEFQIVRDGDLAQAFYPCATRCSQTTVPFRGPDGCGKGRHWVIRGAQHETVKVIFSCADGRASLRVERPAAHEQLTWHDWETWVLKYARSLLLSSSPSGGRHSEPTFMPMIEESTGLHVAEVVLDALGGASFQVLVGERSDMVLYPNEEMTLQGPDTAAEAEHAAWHIVGVPFATFEVTVNLLELDRRRMVSWRPSELKALH